MQQNRGATVSKNLLRELGEIGDKLREVEGVLVTPEALAVLRRTGTAPSDLATRYRDDCLKAERNELIGYRLSSESGLASETCVHVALDPDLDRVVIYEEW